MSSSGLPGEGPIDRTLALLLTGLAILGFAILSMAAFSKFDQDAQAAAGPTATAKAPVTVDLGGLE